MRRVAADADIILNLPGYLGVRWRRNAGIIACLVLLGSGCSDGQQPSYLRIAGSAPSIADAPAARALLVVFWATWCPPCREEMPDLLLLAKRPPETLQIVVVSEDSAYVAIEKFFGGPPDPALHLRLDEDKKLFDGFRVKALPAALLVVDGELRARFAGLRHWNAQPDRALLERLIAE